MLYDQIYLHLISNKQAFFFWLFIQQHSTTNQTPYKYFSNKQTYFYSESTQRKGKRMIQIDFLCTDANIFFYLTTIHTPPFLLRRALKLSFFFSYFNFNPSVIKIMFCYRIFFCVFIDSRNASIITFSRIF